MTVYLLWGQEEYNIKKEIEKLKCELLDSSFKSMNYKILNNPDFLEIIETAETTPLMFGNMIFVINIEKYLVGNKGSIDDKQLLTFEEALKNIQPSVNIVFLAKISRDENKKVDTRKKLYKIISKYAKVIEFPQFKSYQKELPQEIQKIAKEFELSIDTNTINYLIEQLGVNLMLIASELEKLKIAIYPKKQVKIEDIKENCVSSDDVFALADLIVQGNKSEALKQFHQLTERRHYLEVLAVLQTNFQKFIFIKNYEKKASEAQIAQELKIHEFIVKKTKEKLTNISLEKLISVRNNLLEAEYKIKSGKITMPEAAIELAMIS